MDASSRDVPELGEAMTHLSAVVDVGTRHDLPPRWDGHPVVWRGWETLNAFICGGRAGSECCPGCGSRAASAINLGLVGDDPDMTVGDVEHDDHAVAMASKLGHRRRRRSWFRLTAFRCPDCRLDLVVDGDDQCWTLDASDYGDEGSVGPPVQGTLL